MVKTLKYDFFRVIMPGDSQWTFETVLNRINDLGWRDRLYNSGDYPIRLHWLQNGNSHIIGDIARIRMNDIPDKMKLSGETEPLELDADEGLGEITSFLYHPATQVLQMMRNRNAVSITGLNRYVENILNVFGVQYNCILHEDAYRRLDRLVKVQRLDLEVAAPGNGSIFRDLGLSPEAVTDLIGASPRVRLNFAFSTGYERELSLPKRVIERLATAFRGRQQFSDSEDVSLIVSGREDTYEKEVIDLFGDVLTDSYDVNIRNQRKITDEQRRSATIAVWSRHREKLMRLFAPPGGA